LFNVPLLQSVNVRVELFWTALLNDAFTVSVLQIKICEKCLSVIWWPLMDLVS